MNTVMDNTLMRLASDEIGSYPDAISQELPNYLWGSSNPKFKFALSVTVPRINGSMSHPLLSALRQLSYTKRSKGLRLKVEDHSVNCGPYRNHKIIIVRLGY